MDAPTSTFVKHANAALEITDRMNRDLDGIKTALVGRDDAKALHLMRKFFRVPTDVNADAETSENYEKHKPEPTSGQSSTGQRRAS